MENGLIRCRETDWVDLFAFSGEHPGDSFREQAQQPVFMRHDHDILERYSGGGHVEYDAQIDYRHHDPAQIDPADHAG